jgi:hypothetical protein
LPLSNEMLDEKINEINQRVDHHNRMKQSKTSMFNKAAHIADHGALSGERTLGI